MLQLNISIEIIVSLLVGLLLFFALFSFTQKVIADLTKQEKQIWKSIIVLKLTCAIVFGLIHYTRYKFSDTLLYHDFSIYFNKMPVPLMEKWKELFFNYGLQLQKYLIDEGYPMLFREAFVRRPQNFLVAFNSVLNVLFFNSFFAKTLVYSAIGYCGLLLMYRFAIKKYELYDRRWWIVVFFVFPSLLFWSSGILKEAPTLLGMGLSIYYFEEVFMNKNPTIKNILYVIIGLLLCFIMKPFIFILLLIAFPIYYFLHIIYSWPLTKQNVLKLVPILILLIGGLYIVLASGILGSYQLGTVLKAANKLYQNISVHGNTKAGSAYELPFIPDTPEKVAQIIPYTLNLSLFRPYFTESNSLLTKIAAVESSLLLLVSLIGAYFVIFKQRWKRILSDPFLLATLIICIIYFFFIAISSANFGTLTRYKILLIPCYLMALFITIAKERKTDS